MSKLKRMNTKRNIALVGIFVFFMLLFNAPFISIPSGTVGDTPSIILYIGIVWVALILLMIRLSAKQKSD